MVCNRKRMRIGEKKLMMASKVADARIKNAVLYAKKRIRKRR